MLCIQYLRNKVFKLEVDRFDSLAGKLAGQRS
jgi:hypothetical protein